MTLIDRGMIKWAPFKSLPEKEEYFDFKLEQEEIENEPLLCEDEKNYLDRKITYLSSGMKIKVKVYLDYKIQYLFLKFRKIDLLKKEFLFFDHKAIPSFLIYDFDVVE